MAFHLQHRKITKSRIVLFFKSLKKITPPCLAGVVKIVELSQEFEHCGWRLTQEEQHEVMRYTRSQLPPLLATVVRLLTNVRASLTALNHHTRQQLAQQLVPEVRECCFSMREDMQG